jgi:hypothetical protein
MADYRDPKVTTGTKQKSGGMGKWIGITLAVLVLLLLLAWLAGFFNSDEVDVVVPATDAPVTEVPVTEEPVEPVAPAQ